MNFTPVILMHLFAALAAVVVGGAMFLLKKGTPLHRISGRLWLLLSLVLILALAALLTIVR